MSWRGGPPECPHGEVVDGLRFAAVRKRNLRRDATMTPRTNPAESTRPSSAALPAEPLDWGRAPRMNPLETLMWRLEADPHLREPVCTLEILDREPDWKRFLAAADWSTRMVPRCRQKVAEPALGFGNPVWVNDPEFDLDYHVSQIGLPAGGGWPALLKAAAKAAMTPFDRARSPWESILFTGLPGGRAAHLLKLHHSVSDGLGGVQLLAQLHSRSRQANPSKPQPAPLRPQRSSAIGLLMQQLRRDALAIPTTLRHAFEATKELAHPWEATKRAVAFGRSLRRVTAGPNAPGSPLLASRSLSLRFHILDVDLADLKVAAKSVGASINDAFVAALLGTYRMYHEAKGAPIRAMPMAIPISVRRSHDAQGGNRFVGARFAGLVDERDPRARMLAIHEVVNQLRREPAIDAMSMLAPVLTHLPGGLLAPVVGHLMKQNDLQASCVPGLRDEYYLAGAKIERAYGFGPRPGCASMITLVSHGTTCCVAANVDPAAVSDPELFADCLKEGFAEVLSLNPHARVPVVYA